MSRTLRIQVVIAITIIVFGWLIGLAAVCLAMDRFSFDVNDISSFATFIDAVNSGTKVANIVSGCGIIYLILLCAYWFIGPAEADDHNQLTTNN